jgi:hypothetical protein
VAHPDHAVTLARFQATLQRSKNRIIAVPAPVRRQLGLARRSGNHILHVSIRRGASGRWNHHYFKLTRSNEFAIPEDVVGMRPGDRVEVKVHKVIADIAVRTSSSASGAALLLKLAERPRPGWRRDGVERLDEYLRDEIHGSGRAR